MTGESQLALELRERVVFVDGHADLWALFYDASLFGTVVEALAGPLRDSGTTKVAGVEARGFILGAAVAATLRVGFVAIRKEHGLCPGAKLTATTGPDYRGQRHKLRLQRAACGPGDRVTVVDDWFETGSQALAARGLIERCGAVYAGASVIVDQLTPARRQALNPCQAILRAEDLKTSVRSEGNSSGRVSPR